MQHSTGLQWSAVYLFPQHSSVSLQHILHTLLQNQSGCWSPNEQHLLHERRFFKSVLVLHPLLPSCSLSFQQVNVLCHMGRRASSQCTLTSATKPQSSQDFHAGLHFSDSKKSVSYLNQNFYEYSFRTGQSAAIVTVGFCFKEQQQDRNTDYYYP